MKPPHCVCQRGDSADFVGAAARRGPAVAPRNQALARHSPPPLPRSTTDLTDGSAETAAPPVVGSGIEWSVAVEVGERGMVGREGSSQ